MKKAVVEVCNLKLLHLDTGTAEGIMEAILSYLTSRKIDLQKMAGIATDCNEGVTTRLKAIVPLLISTHCSAHRLSLATCEAANSSSSVSPFEKILNQIYSFFSKSSV